LRAKADPEAAPAAPPSAGTLRARALRYLAAREHTRHELHTKLARFCPDQALIEQVLSELEGHGLQDDTRAAHALVRARAARLGVGRLRMELQRRGVPPEVAQQALQHATADTEHVRAQRVWRKRFGEVAPDPATRAKHWRFLIGRGFAPDVVQAVLRAAARDPAA
jgi:regulatory protein